MAIGQWTRIPTNWVTKDYKLCSFKHKSMSASIAALLVYSAIAIKCSQTPEKGRSDAGYARLSYSALQEITCLSRSSVSKGISMLESLNLISVDRKQKPSEFKIIGLELHGWAKFPAKRIMKMKAFSNLHLRHKNELHALKLLFLLIAFRDNRSNTARISYDKIELYTNIHRTDVRSAISLLIVWGLVQVEHSESDIESRSNIYRLCGIDNLHAGNTNYNSFELHEDYKAAATKTPITEIPF